MIVRHQLNGEPVDVEFHVAGDDVTYRIIRHGREAPPFRTVNHREAEPGIYSLIDGFRSYDIRLEHAHYGTVAQHRSTRVLLEPAEKKRRGNAVGGAGRVEIRAAMPGRVVKVLVSEGQSVSTGDGLVVLEAMKMQNEIRAPHDGTVKHLAVQQDAVVAAGSLICLVEGTTQ